MENENQNENVVSTSTPEIDALDKQAAMYEDKLAEIQGKYKIALNALAERGLYTDSAEKVSAPSKEELKKQYNDCLRRGIENDGKTNLDKARELIELADLSKALGYNSPFVSTRGTPTEKELENAETHYEILKYAVDNCNNDPELYTSLAYAHITEN